MCETRNSLVDDVGVTAPRSDPSAGCSEENLKGAGRICRIVRGSGEACGRVQ
jgi:hypothetical protein